MKVRIVLRSAILQYPDDTDEQDIIDDCYQDPHGLLLHEAEWEFEAVEEEQA